MGVVVVVVAVVVVVVVVLILNAGLNDLYVQFKITE